MPIRHDNSLTGKLQAVALIDQAICSIRGASARLQIAKSTLHDNLPKYRQEVTMFGEWSDKSDRRLVKGVLIQAFDGKCSSRDCANTLSQLMNVDTSHQKVLKVLDLASEVASSLNKSTLSFEAIKCPAFDEIFQRQQPILGFVDPKSAVVFIQHADDRTSSSWETFLTTLKGLGLQPKATVTDGGSGLLSGLKKVFSESIQMRDLFHVLNKLAKAKNVVEGKCYGLIGAEDKMLQSKGKTELLEALQIKMNESLSLFDILEKRIQNFRRACYIGQNDCAPYVSAVDLRSKIDECIDILGQIKTKITDHRCVKEAMSYLAGGSDQIIAYKEMIEKSVAKVFGAAHKDMVLQFLCPMIEYLDQYRRAHDSKKRQEFWGKKIADLRSKFRNHAFIDQDEIDRAINTASLLMDEGKKSNSLIETVNSVIRRHLQTYKSIPRWFCSLFTFWWNHRRFARGVRKDMAPCELLTGKKMESDWVEMILERFPFDRLYDTTPISVNPVGEIQSAA